MAAGSCSIGPTDLSNIMRNNFIIAVAFCLVFNFPTFATLFANPLPVIEQQPSVNSSSLPETLDGLDAWTAVGLMSPGITGSAVSRVAPLCSERGNIRHAVDHERFKRNRLRVEMTA